MRIFDFRTPPKYSLAATFIEHKEWIIDVHVPQGTGQTVRIFQHKAKEIDYIRLYCWSSQILGHEKSCFSKNHSSIQQKCHDSNGRSRLLSRFSMVPCKPEFYSHHEADLTTRRLRSTTLLEMN